MDLANETYLDCITHNCTNGLYYDYQVTISEMIKNGESIQLIYSSIH